MLVRIRDPVCCVMWPRTKQNLAIKRNEALMQATLWMNLKNILLRSHTGAVAERSYPTSEVRVVAKRSYLMSEVRVVAERSYPMSEVRSSGCALLEQR